MILNEKLEKITDIFLKNPNQYIAFVAAKPIGV